METNHPTLTKPSIAKVTTRILFDRPLNDGESELLYSYIEEEMGRQDHYGDAWEVLYGERWAITGIEILNAESIEPVKRGVDAYLDIWEEEA